MDRLLSKSHPRLGRKQDALWMASIGETCGVSQKAHSLSFGKRGSLFNHSSVAAKKTKGSPVNLLALKRGLEGPWSDVGSLLTPSPSSDKTLLHPQEGSIALDEDLEGAPSQADHEDLEVINPENAKFKLCQKSYLLTYPQCPEPKEELGEWLMKEFTPTKLIVCQETHHKTEGSHLHAFIEFKKAKTIRNPRTFDWKGYHANICKKKNAKTGWAAGVAYCTKEDQTPFIRGFDMEEYFKASKQKRKYLGQKLNAGMTLQELVKEFPEQRWSIPTLKKAEDILKAPSGDPIGWDRPSENIWICGPPRIGKSYWAHNGWDHPFYLKNQNKWWDGYSGEETIVIDDFRTPLLAAKLINWAGEYKQFGETKGGHVPLQHKRVIITSNFRIDELFKGEEYEKERDALKGRFPEVTIDTSTHELLPFFGDDWRAQMNIEALQNIHHPDWALLDERINKREEWKKAHPNWKNGKFYKGPNK